MAGCGRGHPAPTPRLKHTIFHEPHATTTRKLAMLLEVAEIWGADQKVVA